MLQRNKRLNLKKDFKWVVSGKFIDSQYIKLYLKVGTNNLPRVGIATSSKTFKKATDRNRARRLTSAALEPLHLKLPANLNIVALPKIGILSVKSGDVLLDLETVLEEHKIIHEDASS